MSYLSHTVGTFAIVVLTGSAFSVPAASAQTSAVKDGWLVMKIHSEFVGEDELAGSNIDVDVDKGVVTLKGTVPTAAAKVKAVAEARQNDGVKNVIDELRVVARTDRNDRMTGTTGTTAGTTAGEKMDRATDRAGDKMERAGDKAERTMDKAGDKTENATRSTGRAIDDGWIKSKIYAQYMADWNTVLDDSDIDIDVTNNAVTLSGTVKSAEAKAKAVATAKSTDGVKSVKDNLRVVPNP